ncbi:MAG: hypothetical protein ACPGO3_00910 [Magnetospiraceae bacterium]
MDLLDFEPADLYFDEPIDPSVEALIRQAGETYPDPRAGSMLAEAEALAPENLMVMVAQYRYFYYRHQFSDALVVADRALATTARRLNLPQDWQELTPADVANKTENAPTLLRFHLLTLKGAAYLFLRLGLHEAGLARLDKLRELDSADRLGADALAKTVRASLTPEPLEGDPHAG